MDSKANYLFRTSSSFFSVLMFFERFKRYSFHLWQQGGNKHLIRTIFFCFNRKKRIFFLTCIQAIFNLLAIRTEFLDDLYTSESPNDLLLQNTRFSSKRTVIVISRNYFFEFRIENWIILFALNDRHFKPISIQ